MESSRILVKLPGAALALGGEVSRQLSKLAGEGAELVVLVGGRNLLSEAVLSHVEKSKADYMAMLGSVMNALYLADLMEQEGASVRVQSAIAMAQVAEPYIPLRTVRHLQ